MSLAVQLTLVTVALLLQRSMLEAFVCFGVGGCLHLESKAHSAERNRQGLLATLVQRLSQCRRES